MLREVHHKTVVVTLKFRRGQSHITPVLVRDCQHRYTDVSRAVPRPLHGSMCVYGATICFLPLTRCSQHREPNIYNSTGERAERQLEHQLKLGSHYWPR